MAGVTGGAAKELLEVGGRPIILWALEEMERVPVDGTVVVVSPGKPEIRAAVDGRSSIVVQGEPDGFGAAVALVETAGDVLVANPDTLFFPHSPARRIADLVAAGTDIVLPVQLISDSEVSRYGIVEWSPESGAVSKILEKPLPEETSSRWAVAGRFGLSARAFRFVKEWIASSLVPDISMTPALGEAISRGFSGTATPLRAEEMRLDCGTPASYEHACEVVSRGF